MPTSKLTQLIVQAYLLSCFGGRGIAFKDVFNLGPPIFFLLFLNSWSLFHTIYSSIPLSNYFYSAAYKHVQVLTTLKPNISPLCFSFRFLLLPLFSFSNIRKESSILISHPWVSLQQPSPCLIYFWKCYDKIARDHQISFLTPIIHLQLSFLTSL